MRARILLGIALTLTVLVALWGIMDAQSLTAFASQRVTAAFNSRGWFIMLTSSTLLMVALLRRLRGEGKGMHTVRRPLPVPGAARRCPDLTLGNAS